MALAPPAFGRSIFLNFPYDTDYVPLAQALVFTVLECGFEPRLAVERADSGEVRLTKIKELIRACRFSIHDISRMEALRDGDLPRFNMPFELGLDLGCRYYGAGELETRQCLVLEREQYRYQRVLSDLSGNDIRAHHGEPEALVREVRNWLRVVSGGNLPSPKRLWNRFSLFQGDLAQSLEKLEYAPQDVQFLEISEFIEFARQWRAEHETST